MLLNLAKGIQAWPVSAWLAGSTWAYPAIGALHVLGIAWFGGAVLLSCLGREDLRPRAAFLWSGGVFMLATGALLFITEPLRCVTSYAFGAKMLLLLGLVAMRRVRVPALITLGLWTGVLLVSRGIAFF